MIVHEHRRTIACLNFAYIASVFVIVDPPMSAYIFVGYL